MFHTLRIAQYCKVAQSEKLSQKRPFVSVHPVVRQLRTKYDVENGLMGPPTCPPLSTFYLYGDSVSIWPKKWEFLKYRRLLCFFTSTVYLWSGHANKNRKGGMRKLESLACFVFSNSGPHDFRPTPSSSFCPKGRRRSNNKNNERVCDCAWVPAHFLSSWPSTVTDRYSIVIFYGYLLSVF